MVDHSALDDPAISVITAAHNEAGNVAEFLLRTVRAFELLKIDGEVIFIDDGSVDGTDEAVRQFSEGPQGDFKMTLIRHDECRGLAVAILDGVRASKGNLICFLPSDLESHPDVDIPLLYNALDPLHDVVAGCRLGRDDGKSIASAIAHNGFRLLFGHRWRDANWIKLARRQVLQDLYLRDNWHSFLLPILHSRGCRIREVETEWHRRRYGRSKFGWRRFHRSIVGALGVKLHLLLSGRTRSLRAYDAHSTTSAGAKRSLFE